MKAQTKSVWCFTAENHTYRVPLYQRHYKWEKTHCEALWQDFMRVYNNDRECHYLGCLVVSLENDGCYAIVDGQQRFTSLMLLIQALGGDLRESAENEKLRAFIFNETHLRLQPQNWGADSDYHHFEKAMNRQSHDAHTDVFSRNLSLFEGWIAEGFPTGGRLSVASIINALDRMYFAFVELDKTSVDLDSPAQVFEKMNVEGKDLETQDLIRNYIFMLASEACSDEHPKHTELNASAGQQSLFHNEWLNVERVFPDHALGQMGHFFRDYLILKSGKNSLTAGKDLYLEFKRYLDPDGTNKPVFEGKRLNQFEVVESFANDIWRHADAWGKVVFGNHLHGTSRGTAKLRKALKEFSLISDAKYLPLAMRLMIKLGLDEESSKHDKLAQIFEALSKFAVISLFTKTKVGKVDPRLAELSNDPPKFAQELQNCWQEGFNPLVSLREALLGPEETSDETEGEDEASHENYTSDDVDNSLVGAHYQTRDQFEYTTDSFSLGADFYHANRKAVIFLLLKINEHLMEETGDTLMAFSEQGHSLEHIMPQEPTAHWPSLDLRFHEFRLHFIGNMTLVGKGYNSAISNGALDHKISYYRDSSYALTRRLAHELEISKCCSADGELDMKPFKNYIEDRANWLANKAVELLAFHSS